MSAHRLLLVPSFTELEWGIRDSLEVWAEIATFDTPGVGAEQVPADLEPDPSRASELLPRWREAAWMQRYARRSARLGPLRGRHGLPWPPRHAVCRAVVLRAGLAWPALFGTLCRLTPNLHRGWDPAAFLDHARVIEEDTQMPDSPPYPDAGDQSAVGPGRGSGAGTPRWVKVSVIVVLVLVVLVVVMLLVGGPGGHGPGRH